MTVINDKLNSALLCMNDALYTKMGCLTEMDLQLVKTIKSICDEMLEIDEQDRVNNSTS